MKRGTILPAIVYAIAGGLALAAALWSAHVYSQPAYMDAKACIVLGQFAAAIADGRDIGADPEKHLQLVVKRNAGEPPARIRLLLQEARRVYANPKKSAEELGGEAFERCMLGLLGRDA